MWSQGSAGKASESERGGDAGLGWRILLSAFLKQVRRQEGICRHMRPEKGNGLLLSGLGKCGDRLGGGAECKIKCKGLGEAGNEAESGGGKNRWMIRVAGWECQSQEQGRRGMKSQIRRRALIL